MGMFFHSADQLPERPADPAQRRANLRRIGPLFLPYKLRLGGVLLLIVTSAGLGVVPAFLLKHVLEAIARNDTTSLSYNAGGMIAIAIATGVLGVVQPLLSNQVGQRVMHDLLAPVFRHLQRLSASGRARGAPADGGPLGDGVDPDELRGDASGRVLVRRIRARPRLDCGLDPAAGVVHDPADAAVLPRRIAARRRARRADVARA